MKNVGSQAWKSASVIAAALSATLAVPAGAQVRCGDSIGPGENVELQADLDCSDGAAALIVTGPAVLNLNGFSVDCADRETGRAAPRVGIVVLGSGATVHGGAVRGCRDGVVVAGSGGHDVHDVSVESGAGHGIVLASRRNRLARAHVSRHGGAGVSLVGESNRVSDSTSTSNRVGFRVGHRSILRRNLASGNEREGFSIVGGESLVFRNRAVESRAGYAVHGDGNRIVGNHGERNLIGLFVDTPASGNVLRQNSMSGNFFSGFVVQGSDSELTRNRAEANIAHGIRVTSAARTAAVVESTTSRNGIHDLTDEVPGCGTNRWQRNTFDTRNQTCVE